MEEARELNGLVTAVMASGGQDAAQRFARYKAIVSVPQAARATCGTSASRAAGAAATAS
jgi:hypothetical protein